MVWDNFIDEVWKTGPSWHGLIDWVITNNIGVALQGLSNLSLESNIGILKTKVIVPESSEESHGFRGSVVDKEAVFLAVLNDWESIFPFISIIMH